MRVIFEQSNIAEKILGEQLPDKDAHYRLLKFCFKKQIDEDIVIYNNLTKKMVILSQEENAALNDTEINFTPAVSELITKWFLVPMEHDDLKLSDQLFDIFNLYNKKSFINSYVILTTTDCNARCFYCYEHGVTRNHMDEKTASDTADYIIKKSAGKDVSIKWFGGEPLYNSKAIDIICGRLTDNNIKFTSRMTTNGYLFNDEVIKHAKKNWNLKQAQVTLDGTEQIYNKVKSYIYKDKISPFRIVIDNIEKLIAENIRVTVRLNVSDDNRDDMYNLIDYIDVRFADKDNLNVYAANLFDLKHDRTDSEMLRLNDEYFKLNDYISRKGLKKYRFEKWLSLHRGCMAQNESAVVISPKGLLGKCEHFSEGNHMFGSIYSDEIDKSAKKFWYEHKRISACENCIVYPNCFGEGNCPDLSSRCEFVEKPVKLHDLENNIVQKYYEVKNIIGKRKNDI